MRILLSVAIACSTPLWGQLPGPGARTAAQPVVATPASRPVLPAVQSGFSGSVPSGDAVPGTLDLSLRDALTRGLRYNISVIEGSDNIRLTRAQRLLALSQLLPDINARPAISEQQINLLAYGFPLPPGTPPIVGPLKVVDARAYLTNNLSMAGWKNYRAGNEAVRAAQFGLRDARDQVVHVVIELYLEAIAAGARVDASHARLATAETLYRQAVDRKTAGTAPGIDVLRAQVQMQAQQQQVIYYEGEVEKQKLALARAIGLPPGQSFRLTEKIPYTPLPPDFTLAASLDAAYRLRSDFQATQSLVRAAEISLSAARAARWPSASLAADYGAIGPSLAQSHGTFTVAAAANIPIFDSGRIRAGIDQAEAQLAQRRSELDDLRGRIDADVRVAMLNLETAGRQVQVARSNVDLAGQQLKQSQDRFAAGVTNNLEVVQAQEAVAAADESLISSLYAFNSAKAALMRARGETDEAVTRFLTGK